jgi:hypothetical protein
MTKIVFNGFMAILIIFIPSVSNAQLPDQVLMPNIQSVKLNMNGNPLSYPVLRLNSSDQLELHFDDREGDIKNYSYTWQLCNADWSPALLSSMDYIKGFSSQRIITYRNSSVALTRYTHYQQILPDRNCMPSRSGNYLLVVFLNGNPQNVVFAKRVLVVEEKASVAVQVQQPFNNQFFTTHQKLTFNVTYKNLNLVNPQQQIQVTILQNNRWDNAKLLMKPVFVKPNQLEFNPEEQSLFAGGREWRWIDLRSLRLQTERVDSARYSKSGTDVYVKTDQDRNSLRIVFYRDMNGQCFYENFERLNPYWQGDYANVYFTFKPPSGMPFKGKDLYLFGELTNYGKVPEAKMIFDEQRRVYQTSVWLKQGMYDYAYAIEEKGKMEKIFLTDKTEGDFWETENSYMVLVYYRPLGGRADELICISKINSLTGRPGFNY